MFALTKEAGMAFAFPDVCKTPTPVGPVPIPYPNMGQMPMAEPGALKVLIVGVTALNKSCNVPLTEGDTTGVLGGVVSSTEMEQTKFVSSSEKVQIEGSPAVRFTDATTQNNANCEGCVIEPSQEKVLIPS